MSEHDELVQRHHVPCEGKPVFSSSPSEQHQQASAASPLRPADRADGRGSCSCLFILFINFIFFFLNPSDSFSFYSQQELPAVSSGTDAQQRAGGQTQAAGAGAGGRAVPHTVCLAQRQLLQRVSLRKVQPHFCAFPREPEGNGEGKKIACFLKDSFSVLLFFYTGQLITLKNLIALQKATRLALGFQLLFVDHVFRGRTELTHLGLLSIT